MPADWRVPWRRRDSTLWSRMSNDDFFNDESNGRWDGMNCLISSLSVTEIRLAAGKGSCLLCFWNAKSRSWYQPIRSGLVTSVHDLRRKPVVGIDLHGRLVAINYVARALPVSYDTENQANACPLVISLFFSLVVQWQYIWLWYWIVCSSLVPQWIVRVDEKEVRTCCLFR